MVHPLLITDPTLAALDDSCGMKLWYARFQSGGGVTATKDILSTEMLAATQTDLRMLGQMEDIHPDTIQGLINEILNGIGYETLGKNIRSRELLYRRLGWFAAYAIFIEPHQRKLYTPIPIDAEIDFNRNPLLVRMNPGRVLFNSSTSEVEHREFVPTQSVSARWREGWEWNIQPHLSLVAVREHLQRRIHWGRIQGLNTGYISSTENAQLHHPYVYAHFNKLTGEWTHNFKFQDQDGGNWVERPIWESPLSIVEWIRKCGPTVAETQFPLSPKIPVNEEMVQAWVARKIHRERQIHAMKIACQDNKALRAIHFPQVTSECAPANNVACVYKNLCWSTPFVRSALLNKDFKVNLPLLLTREQVQPPMITLSERVEQAIIDGRASTVEGAFDLEQKTPISPTLAD